MGLIGELVDDDDDICGAVISPRRNEIRFSVWTNTSSNEDCQKAIGRKIRSVLRMEKRIKLSYRVSWGCGTAWFNAKYLEN